MERGEFRIAVLGGEFVRALDSLLRFYREFVPTDGHDIYSSITLSSFASLRMTDLFDFQITNYKLPITNRTGGACLPPPAEFTTAGLCPAGRDKAPSPHEHCLCGFASALRLFAFQRLLAADVYLDLLRLGFGFLRQLDLQHALVIVGLNVVMVDCAGEAEGAGEAAILTLHSAEVLFFLFLLELAFAVHGQSVVLDADVDVLLVDSRHFDLQGDVVLVLVDVDGRSKCGRGQRFILPFRQTGIAEQTVHAVLQGDELTEWIPTRNHGHDSNPPT